MSKSTKPAASAKPAETAPAAAASSSTAVATTTPSTAVAARTGAPAGFTSKRRIVLPTVNLRVGEPRLVVFATPMRVSDYVDPSAKEGEKQKPATVAECGDPSTGEQFLLLVPKVLEENIRRAYSGDDYIGRCFLVEKLPKRPGKRYFDFRVEEGEYVPPALDGDNA